MKMYEVHKMSTLIEKQKQLRIAEITYNKLRVETRILQLEEEKDALIKQIKKHDEDLLKIQKE
jgi:hypothetical protein